MLIYMPLLSATGTFISLFLASLAAGGPHSALYDAPPRKNALTFFSKTYDVTARRHDAGRS